jgi:hypothetical protein
LGFTVDFALLADVANELIIIHAPQGHSSEVAWAMWSLLAFHQNVSPKAAEALGRMDDSIIALLSLDAQSRGLIPTGLDTSSWKQYMDRDELYGQHWLLSYEAQIKGWLTSTSGADHVLADKNFSYLKQHGVSFYDPSASVGAYATTVLSYGDLEI